MSSTNGPAPLGWRCTACLRGLGSTEVALGSLCEKCIKALARATRVGRTD